MGGPPWDRQFQSYGQPILGISNASLMGIPLGIANSSLMGSPPGLEQHISPTVQIRRVLQGPGLEKHISPTVQISRVLQVPIQSLSNPHLIL